MGIVTFPGSYVQLIAFADSTGTGERDTAALYTLLCGWAVMALNTPTPPWEWPTTPTFSRSTL